MLLNKSSTISPDKIPISIGEIPCLDVGLDKLVNQGIKKVFLWKSCLELDVFNAKGKRHTPREWFIAPIKVIEQAIQLIINGKVLKYRYDVENEVIVER